YPLMLLNWLNSDQPYVAGIGQVSLLFAMGSGINFVLIAAHEAGHALAARFAGFEILQITIGSWRKIAACNLGAVNICLRLEPSSGFVTLKPCPNIFSARHMVPFYAAGLVAEMLVVAVVSCLLPAAALETETFGAYALAFLRLSLLVF